MSYKNPTLYEIYVRILFNEGTLTVAKIFDVVSRLKDTGLSNIELIQGVRGVGQSVSPTVEPKVRCWDEQKHRLVQLSRDTMIVNQLKEYLGWSTFQQLIRAKLEILKQAKVERDIQSVELHTIDRFVVNKDGFKMGDWLNCDGKMIPEYYANSAEACDIDLGRAFVNVDGWNRHLNIKVRPREKDVEIRFESGFHNKINGRAFEDLLEELHKESNASFESLITDRVRQEIMHGQVSNT